MRSFIFDGDSGLKEMLFLPVEVVEPGVVGASPLKERLFLIGEANSSGVIVSRLSTLSFYSKSLATS